MDVLTVRGELLMWQENTTSGSWHTLLASDKAATNSTSLQMRGQLHHLAVVSAAGQDKLSAD